MLAATAAEADALATAFYAMGPDAAEAYGHEHPDVAMFMVCGGENAGPVRQKSFGFKEEELTIIPR